MLFMTISNNQRKYNFYLENDEYWVDYADDEYIHTLSENEAKELLKYVFSSEVEYSHDENGYQVYMDPTGNKRYYKDGKEDLSQFFINNGEDGRVYMIDTEAYGNELIKVTNIKVSETLFRMVYVVECALIALNVAYGLKYSNPFNKIPAPIVTLKEASKLIDDSGSLDNQEKQYFNNRIFLEDVLRTANKSRSRELRNRLSDLGIEYFTEEEMVTMYKGRHANGFYNSGILDENKIHLLDDSNYIFDNVAAHEFVHLCQDSYGFIYIMEASAEIMAYEYFGSPIVSYKEAIENTCYLMEIVGPKPIMECNFKGDTSSFEGAIREYLTEEDANDLLNEFRKRPEKSNHEKIKLLIDKMALNKIGTQDIAVYKSIKNRSSSRISNGGYYFNQHKENYYLSFNKGRIAEETTQYNREEDKNIKRLKHNKVRKCENEDLKDVLENPEYDNCAIYVMNNELTGAAKYSIKGIKEQYPTDTYKNFVTYISQGRETRLEWVAIIDDPKEISSTLDNAQNGMDYFAETDKGSFIIRKFFERGVYTKTMRITLDVPSINDEFPEQSIFYNTIEPVNDDMTFTPSK